MKGNAGLAHRMNKSSGDRPVIADKAAIVAHEREAQGEGQSIGVGREDGDAVFRTDVHGLACHARRGLRVSGYRLPQLFLSSFSLKCFPIFSSPQFPIRLRIALALLVAVIITPGLASAANLGGGFWDLVMDLMREATVAA